MKMRPMPTVVVAILCVTLGSTSALAEQAEVSEKNAEKAAELGVRIEVLKERREELESSLSVAVEELQSTQIEQAVILRAGLWDQKEIPVCWENASAVPESEREWVRDAVRDTWEAHSAVRFKGWGACGASDTGIRILAQTSGPGAPHVKRLGKLISGVKDGMVLRFAFGEWAPACQVQKEFCIRAIAAHEFGHALAFAHEQNRPDAPQWCREQAQGTSGDERITIYDQASIMNYCNPSWNNSGLLSDLDKEAVGLLYGANAS